MKTKAMSQTGLDPGKTRVLCSSRQPLRQAYSFHLWLRFLSLIIGTERTVMCNALARGADDEAARRMRIGSGFAADHARSRRKAAIRPRHNREPPTTWR